MTFTVSLGWWLAPAIFTVAILLAWRLFGVRMRPLQGSMFPDAGGALMEIGGYLVALLLSVIAWLAWALLS
jgi:hypothetical protein